MSEDYTIEKDSLKVSLDANVFSKNAIIKCLYWYTKDFLVEHNIRKNRHQISLVRKNKEIDLSTIKIKLNQDLNDFNLRDIVNTETKMIRELITAKAFSNGEFDEDSPGTLDDPLGIKFI